MNVEHFGKGAIKQEHPDPRNYKYEELVCAAALTPFDWEAGFTVESRAGELYVDNQGSSSSCTSQAWSKYKTVLDVIETDSMVELSAKDIYSRIFQQSGGAYIMDGAKLLKNRGVCKESSNSSYENGKPPSEPFMREIIETPAEEVSEYGAKSYAFTTHNDIEWIAQMIRDNNGVVTGFTGDNAGWAFADIKPTNSPKWAHCVYLVGACMRNGKKAIKFINSWGKDWGDNGYGYFYADSLGNMFDIWTLVDKVNKPNQETMKIIGDASNQKDLYALGKDGKIRLIFNLEARDEYHDAGMIDKMAEFEWKDISGYEKGLVLLAVQPE